MVQNFCRFLNESHGINKNQWFLIIYYLNFLNFVWFDFVINRNNLWISRHSPTSSTLYEIFWSSSIILHISAPNFLPVSLMIIFLNLGQFWVVTLEVDQRFLWTFLKLNHLIVFLKLKVILFFFDSFFNSWRGFRYIFWLLKKFVCLFWKLTN